MLCIAYGNEFSLFLLNQYMIRNCLRCAELKPSRRRRGVEEFNRHSASNYNFLWSGHSSLPFAVVSLCRCRIIDRLIRGADTTFIQLSNFINWSSAVSGLVLVLIILVNYVPSIHPDTGPTVVTYTLLKCGLIKVNCNRTPGRRAVLLVQKWKLINRNFEQGDEAPFPATLSYCSATPNVSGPKRWEDTCAKWEKCQTFPIKL